MNHRARDGSTAPPSSTVNVEAVCGAASTSLRRKAAMTATNALRRKLRNANAFGGLFLRLIST
jgi:hypothetical protein